MKTISINKAVEILEEFFDTDGIFTSPDDCKCEFYIPVSKMSGLDVLESLLSFFQTYRIEGYKLSIENSISAKNAGFSSFTLIKK